MILPVPPTVRKPAPREQTRLSSVSPSHIGLPSSTYLGDADLQMDRRVVLNTGDNRELFILEEGHCVSGIGMMLMHHILEGGEGLLSVMYTSSSFLFTM